MSYRVNRPYSFLPQSALRTSFDQIFVVLFTYEGILLLVVYYPVFLGFMREILPFLSIAFQILSTEILAASVQSESGVKWSLVLSVKASNKNFNTPLSF